MATLKGKSTIHRSVFRSCGVLLPKVFVSHKITLSDGASVTHLNL